MGNKQKIKTRCHVCGKQYMFYLFYVGDQSTCIKCKREDSNYVIKDKKEVEK